MISVTSGHYTDLHWLERTEDKTQYTIVHPHPIVIDQSVHLLFHIPPLTTVIRDYIPNAPLLALSCFPSTWFGIEDIYKMLYSTSDNEKSVVKVIGILESCCKDEKGELFTIGRLSYGMHCNLKFKYDRIGMVKYAEEMGYIKHDSEIISPILKIRKAFRGDNHYVIHLWLKGLFLKNSAEVRFQEDDPTQPISKVFLALTFGNLDLVKEMRGRDMEGYLLHLRDLYGPFLQELVADDIWSYIHEGGDVLNASLRSTFSASKDEGLPLYCCQWGAFYYFLKKHLNVISSTGHQATVQYEGKEHSLRLVSAPASANGGPDKRYVFYVYGNGAMLPYCYILLMVAYRFLGEDERKSYVREMERLSREHFGTGDEWRSVWKGENQKDRMKDFIVIPPELEECNTVDGVIPDGF